jgi:cellulose synthase/poly-beta-1,6-N-acetylglucosamine synthase-like glycosyltransferase
MGDPGGTSERELTQRGLATAASVARPKDDTALLHTFNLYDLFVLSFVQLVVATVLVWGPARDLDTRFRWTGSRITEVLLGALGSMAVSAVSCVLVIVVWGLAPAGVETAAYLLAIFSVVMIVVRPDCSVVSKIFYAAFAAAGFTFIGFAVLVAVAATHSIAEALTSSLWLGLDLGAFLIWNSHVHYLSDVLGRTRHTRPAPQVDPTYQPMVSLHIPAYNEPPDLLIATIRAVEQIDYPDFEIVVIDNNTTDPAVYGPVEEYCRGRERVTFVHVAPWPGYKAGACNLALRDYTDPRAEIVGLVDADDIVAPYYLRETAGYFSDARIGFVQTCEGNRDYEGSAYSTACVHSYKGFYLAVMSSRNERDSVPFVGTMGLFRRRALEDIGGWNEWCISEDTEASLRVLKAGWSGQYIPRTFGRGIVPPTYAGLNTQRHRWCFGAMQILRLHWRSLMPWDRSPDNHLTFAQRRDYLIASLSWFRDLMMLGFALLLLVVTGLLVTGSHFALMPLAGRSTLLPMSLIIIATLTSTRSLQHWTPISRRQTILGLVISLSACWITALACVQGMTHREGVFLRTSKTGATHRRFRKALRLSRVEILMAAALYSAAALLVFLAHAPVLLLSIVFVQGTVYLCSPIASLWNMRSQQVPSHVVQRRLEARRARPAGRTRRPLVTSAFSGARVLAVAAGVAIAVFAAPRPLMPAPTGGHQSGPEPVHLVNQGP